MFRLLKFDHKRLVDNKKAVIILKYNKNRQKASLPVLPIFLGEHIERQLREVARVRYEELKNQTRAELVQTLDAMMAGSEVVSCGSV